MSDTTQDSRTVVENWYAALAAGDMEGVIGALHEDVVVNVLGCTPVSGRHVGRDAFVANAVGPIFAKLDPETVRFAKTFRIFAADGGHVAALMEGGGATHNGKRYDNTYCHLFAIEDGQITEMYEFLDTVLVEHAIFDNELATPQPALASPVSF